MPQSLKEKINRTIFEIDTPSGRIFNYCLIALIVIAVLSVILESVKSFSDQFRTHLYYLECGITIIFTLEYFTRIYVANRRSEYIFSFYGIIDALTIIPFYISLLFPALHYLVDIRILRLLRIFRILKLARYVREIQILTHALKEARLKIFVFVLVILTIAVILGSLMYLVEGDAAGFTSIPVGIYWAVTTVTTVGYGDITPVSSLGKALATAIMVMGYGVIAVPTGIFTVELSNSINRYKMGRSCSQCAHTGHQLDAQFCYKCGEQLPAHQSVGEAFR